MLAQAFTLTEPPAGAEASAAPPRSSVRRVAQPSTSTVKVRPAAPTMNWRRVMPACGMLWFMGVVMASALPHGALDRAHDARIGAAAAHVRAHVVLDLLARRIRFRREQRRGAHQLARLAVAALRHALGEPRALQRVHAIGREALDRRDRFALHARDRHQAGEHALAVDVHHAGAALARAAAELGARDLQLLAQHPQEARALRRFDADRLAVDSEFDRHDGSFVLGPRTGPRDGLVTGVVRSHATPRTKSASMLRCRWPTSARGRVPLSRGQAGFTSHALPCRGRARSGTSA